jgi:hypothetical protein
MAVIGPKTTLKKGGDGKIDLECVGGCPQNGGELARDGHE